MNDFKLSQGRLPIVKLLAVLLLVLLLDFIPLPPESFFWLPSFSAMFLYFLAMHRPQTFGLFSAFLLGLLVDTGTAAPLGQHALSFVLTTFIIQLPQISARLRTPISQTVGLLLALLFNQAILSFLNAVSEQQFNHPENFIGAVTGMLLWPMFDKILLSVFQLRRFPR